MLANPARFRHEHGASSYTIHSIACLEWTNKPLNGTVLPWLMQPHITAATGRNVTKIGRPSLMNVCLIRFLIFGEALANANGRTNMRLILAMSTRNPLPEKRLDRIASMWLTVSYYKDEVNKQLALAPDLCSDGSQGALETTHRTTYRRRSSNTTRTDSSYLP